MMLLSGCAAQSGTPLPPLDQNIQSLLTNLKTVSIADLQNAETIAVANQDVLMAPCYPALTQFVTSFAGPTGTINGAFSAFETARVTRRGMMGGLPDYLKLGCSAGVMDEAMFVSRLAGMLGLAGTLGPIAPIVAPLMAPAPIQALPAPAPPASPPEAPQAPVKRARPAPVVMPPPAAAHALDEMQQTDRALALARAGL